MQQSSQATNCVKISQKPTFQRSTLPSPSENMMEHSTVVKHQLNFEDTKVLSRTAGYMDLLSERDHQNPGTSQQLQQTHGIHSVNHGT
jgi:hypothetical protein